MLEQTLIILRGVQEQQNQQAVVLNEVQATTERTEEIVRENKEKLKDVHKDLKKVLQT